MWDTATRAAAAAIDGLARRTDIRAHNLANAHTPGYRAQHLPFERDLAAALRAGRPPQPTTATEHTPSVVDDRGNSVDLETELISAMRDQLHRDAMVAAFNFKVSQVRLAFTGNR